MKRLTLFALIIGIMYWYGFDHARIILNAQELSDFKKQHTTTITLMGKTGGLMGGTHFLLTTLFFTRGSVQFAISKRWEVLHTKNLISSLLTREF
jgi:hypothetical protein